MARLPYINIDQLIDNDRDLLKRPINLFRQLVNSPDGARAFGTLADFIRHKSTLNPRLREMAIIQVGYLTNSEYEYTHHVRLGTEQFGVTEDDINAITLETNGKKSSFPKLEQTILRATRDMVTNLKIIDTDFEFLKGYLSNEHLIDLVLTISFYCGVVRVLATLEIDNEPHYKEVLEKFPLSE